MGEVFAAEDVAARPSRGRQAAAGRARQRSGGDRALPARGAHRLVAEPPEHLHAVRHRRAPGPALHGDGAARRRVAQAPASRRGPLPVDEVLDLRRATSPARSRPRIARASCTATSSRPTCSSPRRGASRCSTSAWPSSPRPADGARTTTSAGDERAHHRRHGHRHGGLHVARAGARPGHRRAQRSLLARRRALRDGDRHVAVSRQPRRDDLRGHSHQDSRRRLRRCARVCPAELDRIIGRALEKDRGDGATSRRRTCAPS